MGMAAIFFSSFKLLEQVVSTACQKNPCEIWWKLVSDFIEDLQFYTCTRPKGKGKHPQGIKFWF